MIEQADELKLAKEELRRMEERLGLLIENSLDVILVLRADGIIHFSSPSVERILGHKAPSLIKRSLFEFVEAHDLPKVLQAFNEAVENPGKTQPAIFRFQHKDGSWRILESLMRNLLDRPVVEGVVLNLHDVTELTRAQEIVQKTADELARSNQELEQFAYAASHDLQEPLRKITSYIQLLAERCKGQMDESADKYIGYVVDGASRMQALIKDLLSYSRVGRGELVLERTDFAAVAAQALSNLETAIRDNKAVVTVDGMPTAMANASQMTQLFQNLIGNAIKYHGEAPPRVQVSGQRKGQEWLFSIRDNGIGIDPIYFDRIFVIFQRLHTRQEYSGTGIGLAICKKIVERHGGRVWVESEPGAGTTFFFTLP